MLKCTDKKDTSDIINPKIEIEDVSDFYTLYVLIFHISENVFWDFDIKTVQKIAQNISIFKSWESNPKKKGG